MVNASDRAHRHLEQQGNSTVEDSDLIAFLNLVSSHVPEGIEPNEQQVEFLIDVNMKTVTTLHAKLLASSAVFEASAGKWEAICNEISDLASTETSIAFFSINWFSLKP